MCSEKDHIGFFVCYHSSVPDYFSLAFIGSFCTPDREAAPDWMR